VEHGLYWLGAESRDEAYFLLAILNSETSRRLAEHLQSRGQWGARHFDKVMLSLPIPPFNRTNRLHMDLAEAAAYAETVAAQVTLDERMHFTTVRKRIRAALDEDGISKKIDALVARLLNVRI